MWFLCVFYHRLLDFRKPEVEALAELFGEEIAENESLQWRLPEHHHNDTPFHFVQLSSEEIASNIAKRSRVSSLYHFFLILFFVRFSKPKKKMGLV